MLLQELNEISDDALFVLVDGAVVEGDNNAENLQPLAPFITLELLRRVHERVVSLKQSGCTSSTKHKCLARAVLRITGVPVPPDDRDVDKIGNHLDIWLTRRYIQVDKKIVKNTRDAEVRASRRASLQLQCCVVTAWGGVAEYIHTAFDEPTPLAQPNRSKAPYVPYTSNCLPQDVSMLELKCELNSARSDAQSATAELDRERQRCSVAKRRFESAQAEGDAALRLVELANQEKVEVSKQADKKLKMMNQHMRAECARLQRESSCALRDVQAQVHRLGGRAAAAAMEAAAHAQREQNLRVQLELEREWARKDAKHFKESLTSLRLQMTQAQRESEKALRDAEAKVLRLGSQVAAAAQEAAIHAQKEEKARYQLEMEQERAEAEAERLQADMRRLRFEGVCAQRQAKQALQDAEAKVLRLGSQAAAAAQEAAAHARKEEKARRQLEEEQERAESEVESLRMQMQQLHSEGLQAQRQSAQALRDVEAKVYRLGSQVAAAAQEAAVHAQREEAALRKEEERCQELQEAVKTQECFRLKAEVESQTRRELARQCTAANVAREALKETSQRRLQAKHALTELVAQLRENLDAAHEELHILRKQRDAHTDAAEKLTRMPTWQRHRSSSSEGQTRKRGGGLQLEHAHRLAILEQHANGTPASAIGQNIVSIVNKAAPWLKPVQPTVREIRQMGFELTTLEEALSARRCASAFKVRLLGFDETTDLHQPVLTSNVQIQDFEDGNVCDLVLKAAYLATRGGTSEAVAEQIEDLCFARLRELLRLWKTHHVRLFPTVQWTGPDPQLCSLHRLAGGGALMSDTCNAARKAKRLLAEFIGQQAESAHRLEHGDETWESMSEEERKVETQVYQLDCHQHLRNIWLGHMSRRQAEHVQQELSEQLKQFNAWERMSTQYDQLLRAVYKEFHSGGRYYKGKGADFSSWMLEHHPTAFFMHIERAEGGRQDLDYDASVPIYTNRSYLVKYLHSHVFATDHKNILEDFLYQALLTTQFIAMSRANAVIDLRISRPHRWLSGKTNELQNWSPIQMNGVLDLIDAVFQRASIDGSVLLDPDLDIFKSVAESQPLFRAYQEFTDSHDLVLSPNGKVRHLHYKLALAEVLDPQDETNRRTQQLTIEYLKVQAAAALEKMYDPKLAIANQLTSQGGVNSLGNQAGADEALRGVNSTNDATAESVFGAWKYERTRNLGISVRRSSGLAQARISKALAHADAIQHRRSRVNEATRCIKQRKQSCMFGYFHGLPHSEQVALVEMCRIERVRQRKLDQADMLELDAFRGATRKSNSQLELEALIKNFAIALSFFDRYKQRGVASMEEVHSLLPTFASDQLRLDWIREQIEMRVLGLGWIEFKAQWSSEKDENIGTIKGLTEHLADILTEEAERPRQEAAAAPIMRRKTFKELGTPTVEAEQLADQRLSLSSEQLLAAAEAKRAELEARGELDTVLDRQPKEPPPLDESLVGHSLEIHWRYWRAAKAGERGKKKQVFIWCEGVVAEVSDGTIRKSKRSKESLPAGAVRIRWPADADFDERETLVWSILNPSDWCKEVHLGWRWAPCELDRLQREAQAKARQSLE